MEEPLQKNRLRMQTKKNTDRSWDWIAVALALLSLGLSQAGCGPSGVLTVTPSIPPPGIATITPTIAMPGQPCPCRKNRSHGAIPII
jgi:hypothetical protein